MIIKLLPTDSGDIGEGLQARIADPLWLLYRQWSLDEFTAEDAGTPIRVEVSVETRVLDAGALPLETRVEAESLRGGAVRFRVAAELGREAIRVLGELGRQAEVAHLRAEHPLSIPDDTAPRDRMRARLWAKYLLDGLSVLENTVDAELRDALQTWLDATYVDGTADWNPAALAYSGRIASDGLVLDCEGYPGGRLDWPDWTVSSESAGGTVAETVVLPTRASFPGMPHRRFWSCEDANVNFGDTNVQLDRIPQFVVGEFAIAYADDWFVVPVSAARGVAARVVSIQVTDVFGVQTEVLSSQAVDAGHDRPASWGLWQLHGAVLGDQHGPWVLSAPPLADPMEGPPIEVVRFFEDEQSNLGWAIEERVPAACGGAFAPRPPPPDVGAGPGWRWTLTSRVPAHWYPLVPTPRDDLQVDLVLGRTPAQAEPRSALLGDLLSVPEETLRGSGFSVRRRWQRSRLPDGRAVLWLGRERRETPVEGQRVLVYDTVTRGPGGAG